MRPTERALVPLPASPSPVTAVRGTLLGGSLRTMQQLGLREAYFEQLPSQHHEAVMALVPMSWIPTDVAMAHYRAMDALVSDPKEQRASGHFVGERVQRSYLHTLVRALQATGLVTPPRLLERMPTIWGRMFRGGAVSISQVGPKDLRVRTVGLPLFSVPYFREGWEGVWESGLSLVTRKIYVRRLGRSDDSLDMTLAWV